MIERFAAYEINAGYANQAVVDFAINQLVARDLKQLGLVETDIISRERIENGAEVRRKVAGREIVNLRYCDRIVLPGDE